MARATRKTRRAEQQEARAAQRREAGRAVLKPAGVHHVAIKARDVAGTAAFYRDVLGLEEDRSHEDARGLRSIWLRAGASIVMIERSEAGGGGAPSFEADPPGLHLLALAVPRAEREAWRAHLAGSGVAVLAETLHTLYVQDPEGNRIGLSSLE